MKTQFALTTATIFAIFAGATPAAAASRYLKSTGSGTACTSTAPCSSMIAALAAAGPGGIVTCLDRGNFSGFVFVNIAQSVRISCGDGLWQGAGTALRITPPAGGKVVIEGFVSEGESSVNQIIFEGQGTLELLRVRVTNSTSGNGGLAFKPNGNATLRITDSAFLNNTGSGILISPSAGATDAHIRDTIANGNAQGGVTVTRTGEATANVALENVTASGNNVGLNAGVGTQASVHGGAFTDNFYGVVARGKADITLSTVSGNQVGIFAPVPNGSITLAQSRIFGNETGLQSVAGGKVLSFGNNAINGNTVDGAPTAPALALK